MCDRGRNDFAWVNDNRLTEAEHAGGEVQLRTAIDQVCNELKQRGNDVAVLLSPKLANEDLLVWHRLFTELHPVQALGAGSIEPLQEEDDILRKADPHPNSSMVRSLGLECDVRQFLSQAKAKMLLIIGDDPVGWDESLGAALAKFEFVAAWMVNRNATTSAVAAAGGWTLPLASHFEFAGSFSNFEGRVQRFEPALALLDSALPGYEYGIEIAHTLGKSLWPQDTPENILDGIWKQLAPLHKGLPAVSWADVPANGLVPHWTQTASPRSVMAAADAMGSGFAPAGEVSDHG